MTRHDSRSLVSGLPKSFRKHIVIVTFVLFVCGLMPVVNAQQAPWRSQNGYLFQTENTFGWVRHSAGQQIGDEDAFTAVGGSGYRYLHNGLWMASAQVLITNDAMPGGNFGVVRRFWLDRRTVIGGGFFYDASLTPWNNTFQQTSGSLEIFHGDWTVRSNVYLPVGPRVQNELTTGMISNPDQVRFMGNNLVTGGASVRLDEVAMKGVDVEVAKTLAPMPIDAYVGYYHFEGRIGEDTDGIKGGLRGFLLPKLSANLTVSDDNLFGTNVFGGLTLFFGCGRPKPGCCMCSKMTQPVERNSQVVVNQVQTMDISTQQILTDQGNAIAFTHVNDSGAGGSGTFEDPYGILGDASNSGADIVYVHSGTVFDGQGISLSGGQRFLGEGDNLVHMVQTDQLGLIPVPQVNGLAGARPVIQNSLGNAIAGGSIDQISNFRILNSGSAAVALSNAGGTIGLDRLQIENGETGIDIFNSSGQFLLANVSITDPTVDGIHLSDGTADVSFSGNNTITQGAIGSALRVDGGHTGVVDADSNVSIVATNGTGLQFDDADGQYDFNGPVSLNGGDAGIDIVGDSDGSFTFADTTIVSPSGIALNIEDSSASVKYSGGSITQNSDAAAINVTNHITATLNFGIDITATNGTGLQFTNADGIYNFNTMSGATTLAGGDAGIDILGDSAGTFTFANTDITSPTGIGLNIEDSSAAVTYSGGSITQANNLAAINVNNHNTGAVNFGVDITATNGTGLQFNNADGTYNFNSMAGVTTLNGGDAGIDILGGSAGTFTFADTTTITNPTGVGLNVQNLDAGGTINYNGSIVNNNDNIWSIETTAAGSQVNFNSNGANSLTSTDNPNGAMYVFDADGDITVTTPTTVTRAGFSSLFATDGDGTWTFNDMTIVDQIGLNGGVDVFGNMGTVNFDNVNITTDSAGTGDGTTGFLAGGNNSINVTGSSSVNADGGAAVAIINANQVNMTWQSLTSTNNTNTQIGFGGDDGVDLLNVVAGNFDVVGTTTVDNADGVGISIENSGVTATFANIALSNIGQDGVISGVAFDNPGIFNINGGTMDNIGADGARIGSGNFGSGVLGGFNLNNVTFTNIGVDVVNLSNSVLSGSGNVAVPFSCTNLGGNTGEIFFNGGADSCGQ